MFGSNTKKKEPSKSNAIIPSSTTHSLNSLVQDTLVEGTIQSESDIRVDGTIKGHLVCKAKVIIGPTGFIKGEVQCQNAVVEGKFEGTMTVAELLNIREKAKIIGEINTKKLIVQSGAEFNVTCAMGKPSRTQKNNGTLSSSSEKEAKKVVKTAKAAGA